MCIICINNNTLSQMQSNQIKPTQTSSTSRTCMFQKNKQTKQKQNKITQQLINAYVLNHELTYLN